MKIAIFGDSYAASNNGWPLYLSKMLNAEIHNTAEKGTSLYHVLKSLRKLNATYDYYIFTSTSKSRFPISNNRTFIVNSLRRGGKDDEEVDLARELFYKHVYDEEFFSDLYHLIFNEILNLLKDKKYICLPVYGTLGTDFYLRQITDLENSVLTETEFLETINNSKIRPNHMFMPNNIILAEKLSAHIKGDILNLKSSDFVTPSNF